VTRRPSDAATRSLVQGVCTFQELEGLDIKGSGQARDRGQRRVAPPPLQAADVGPIDRGALCKTLLGDAPSQPRFTDGTPKAHPEIVGHLADASQGVYYRSTE
jgi:hypothetical protein